MKPATIYDVAREAGVSHQTVCRFLAGFKGIRPETRGRVERAIAELRYRPNSAARALRSSRSRRIGILTDRVDERSAARVIAAAGAVARVHGFLVDVLADSGQGPAAETIELLRAGNVSGVLTVAQADLTQRRLEELLRGIPVMLGARALSDAEGRSASGLAGRLAADHLVDLGHRKLGYVAGPDGWSAARDHRSGFFQRARERGASVPWIRVGDGSAASGHAAWAHDVARSGITALAAANDAMAIGLIAAAVDEGHRVPGDLSVIGTDDIPEARYLATPLSTVALDFEGEGRAAMAALLEIIEPGITGHPAIHPPRLQVRNTTAEQHEAPRRLTLDGSSGSTARPG